MNRIELDYNAFGAMPADLGLRRGQVSCDLTVSQQVYTAVVRAAYPDGNVPTGEREEDRPLLERTIMTGFAKSDAVDAAPVYAQRLVCIEALVTRSCRFGHEWRDYGKGAIPIMTRVHR